MAHIQPPPVLAHGLSRVASLVSTEIGDLPKLSTTTFIGILVAISGNVLISFALNLQKLVHKRIEKENGGSTPIAKRNGHFQHPTLPEETHEDLECEPGDHPLNGSEEDGGESTPRAETSAFLETQPLVPLSPQRDYGSSNKSLYPTRPALQPNGQQTPHSYASTITPLKLRTDRGVTTAPALPVDIVTEDAALHGLESRKKLKRNPSTSDSVESNEGDYLKSKVWWLGFLLMNIGEVGNFISYAFAPASVVAPLGTFALIANCFFAPLMLKERFRKRDLLGVLVAIIGAVTVVLASNASNTRLDSERLIEAIKQIPFLVFSAIYIVGVMVLATLSQSSLGRRWVFIDVGLCALFGGFTVLCTKAISTLLASEGVIIFTKWITYPLILGLAGTGVGQIRYLNRALMRFDSKMVIPIQFVLFTLSAIVGSAILYGDFKTAQFHQIVTFLYGCAATFAGVFIIAWSPASEYAEDDGPAAAQAEDGASALESPDSTRLGLGTVGRRRRATLVLPSGVSGVRDTPSVRHKRSTLGMGISPAQHLLLVHTPSTEIPLSAQLHEDGMNDADTELGISSPESYGRQRALSWYGNESSTSSRTRESSLTGRRPRGPPMIRSARSEAGSCHR